MGFFFSLAFIFEFNEYLCKKLNKNYKDIINKKHYFNYSQEQFDLILKDEINIDENEKDKILKNFIIDDTKKFLTTNTTFLFCLINSMNTINFNITNNKSSSGCSSCGSGCSSCGGCGGGCGGCGD